MNLIYSYWLSRPVLPGAEYGAKTMAEYAKRIGAEFRFDRHSPFTDRLGVDPRWFDKLRPCFDPAFSKYDKVLVVDSDVFPVDGLTASIFDEPVGDFGMVEEPDQPEERSHPAARIFTAAMDLKWAAFVERELGSKPPRDAKGRPRTWNAGVILLTQAARARIAADPVGMRLYHVTMKRAGLPPCFGTEQQYLNMLAFSGRYAFTELPLDWNRMVQAKVGGGVLDRRDANTKFVHVMHRAADHNDAAWHHRIVHEHLTRP